MATWTAKVFVNSQVGTINTEVEAATFSGAKQQIYAKHGNVQQITNLHQLSNRSSSGGSSFSSGDSEGFIWLAGIAFVLYLLVTYWYIVIPIAVVLGILAFIGMKED